MRASKTRDTSAEASTVRISEDVRVVDEVDVCVLGGSCTGLFAAVRAARMGVRRELASGGSVVI